MRLDTTDMPGGTPESAQWMKAQREGTLPKLWKTSTRSHWMVLYAARCIEFAGGSCVPARARHAASAAAKLRVALVQCAALAALPSLARLEAAQLFIAAATVRSAALLALGSPFDDEALADFVEACVYAQETARDAAIQVPKYDDDLYWLCDRAEFSVRATGRAAGVYHQVERRLIASDSPTLLSYAILHVADAAAGCEEHDDFHQFSEKNANQNRHEALAMCANILRANLPFEAIPEGGKMGSA